MAQTQEGALKIAAKKAGVEVSQYVAEIKAGRKWCTLCRAWHSQNAFGKDSSRWDGLVPSCKESKNSFARNAYAPQPPLPKGRKFIPARDGDSKQARRRINYFVELGLFAHPNTLPCADCNHEWRDGERRHEYDHYLGYAPEHHETVQAVCSTCHHKREAARGETA